MNDSYTLITGASSGIGRSIAQKLAVSRKLVLSGRNREKLETARRTCANPEQHLLWVQDLEQPASIAERLTALLAPKKVSIDHFVHSAGFIPLQPVRTVEMADVTRTFNVHVFSAIEITRLLVRQSVNKNALRSITFISSISSRMGQKASSVYSAAKGALNALARSLAVELAPNVRVNAILPGAIETDGTKHLFADPGFVASLQATCPLGPGRTEDIADAVEFIASDRARWITGQEIVVDGGRSILL